VEGARERERGLHDFRRGGVRGSVICDRLPSCAYFGIQNSRLRLVGLFGRGWRSLRTLHRTDVPVAPASQRVDVTWLLPRIAQHFANPCDGVMQAVVKIDEGVGRPDSVLQFLARYNVAGAFQQDLQHPQGLAAQAQPYTLPAQLSRRDIQLEIVEAKPS